MTPGGASSAQGGRLSRSRTARRTAKLAVLLLVALVCGGWIYRATLYWRIPVEPGEPYGLGDVIELLVSGAVLGVSALSLGAAALFAAVPSLRHWRSVAALAGAGLLALPVYLLVHPHVPQLMSATQARRAR